MERQNRFDEAIRAKLGGLEDEPSRRVWAGVSGEVGTIRPPQANPWIFRVAAAVAVLALVGGGLLWISRSAASESGLPLMAKSKARHIKIVPIDRMGQEGIYLAENPEPVAPAPRRQSSWKPSLAQLPTPDLKVPAKDSLNQPSPAPFGPGLDPAMNDKGIARQDIPQPDANPNDGRQTPDAGTPKSLVPVEVLTPSHKAYASNNSKRSIKLPSRADLSPEGLRRKSGAILGAVTNGASEFLGLNASYKEKQEEDLKMTAFNADFGLFKIKRVKTVKQ